MARLSARIKRERIRATAISPPPRKQAVFCRHNCREKTLAVPQRDNSSVKYRRWGWMGVKFSGEKHYEGEWYYVISVTRGWEEFNFQKKAIRNT